MGVAHQPVEDGIAKRGVPDAGVPVVDGQLTGDQRGAAPDPILDAFEEITPFAVAERGQAPVSKMSRSVIAKVCSSFPCEFA